MYCKFWLSELPPHVSLGLVTLSALQCIEDSSGVSSFSRPFFHGVLELHVIRINGFSIAQCSFLFVLNTF